VLDALAKSKLLSLDDLLKLGNPRILRAEIIDGRLVKMNVSGFNVFAARIESSINEFVRKYNLGSTFYDGLAYLMLSDVNALKNLFIPDISFIHRENQLRVDISKPYLGVPDLAVEVISPGEKADDIQTKLRTYLAKGTEQVWLVYPTTKELHQYRRDNNPEIRIYRGSQMLDLADLFPGLELTTDQIFAIPEWALR
jgi:Uma2 family endonuclease